MAYAEALVGGFLTVPNDGIRVCRNATERAVYLWLVEQADMFEWEPFEARNTDIIEAGRNHAKHAPAPGWVPGFLGRLVKVGGLVIVEPGCRRVARIVCVPRPWKVSQGTKQADKQTDKQETPGSKPNSGRDESSDESSDESRRSQTKDQDQDLKTPDSDKTSVQLLWDHNRAWHPRRKAKPGASDSRCLRARLNESDLETCKLVADFCHSPGNWWLENDRVGIGTLYKAGKWSDRVDSAQAWHDRGRPTGTGNNGRRSIDQVFGDIEAEFNTPPAEYAEYEEVEQHGDA